MPFLDARVNSMRDDRLANGLPGELVIPTTLAFVVSAWASASRTGEGLPLALMTTTREVAPELMARRITIHQAQLVSIERGSQADSLVPNTCLWVVDFCVSKGTYIRSIARDLGRELGCGAHISALRRAVSGTISLADCMDLALFEEHGRDMWNECCLDPARALELPIRQVSSQELADVLVGRHIAAGEVTCRKLRHLTFSGQCVRTLSPNGYGRKLRRYLLMLSYELFQNTFRVSTVK